MVMGFSHVVPGQEAGSQSHTSGQHELEAGLAQHSQGCSEGTTATFQGTCVAAPTGDMASVGMLTQLPWEGSSGYTRPTFVLVSSVIGAFTHISFPIVHGEPILQVLFGQQGASLVQFTEYLQEQRSNTITGLLNSAFKEKPFFCSEGARAGKVCSGCKPAKQQLHCTQGH